MFLYNNLQFISKREQILFSSVFLCSTVSFKLLCEVYGLCSITTRWQCKTVHTVAAGPCGTQIKKITVKAPLRSTPRPPPFYPSGKRSSLTLSFDILWQIITASVKAVASCRKKSTCRKNTHQGVYVCGVCLECGRIHVPLGQKENFL